MKRTELKRGKPPQRRTELTRKTELRRTSELQSYAVERKPRKPMQRRKSAMAATPKTQSAKPAGRTGAVPKSIRELLYARALGLCECCGAPLPEKGWHAHHRVRRSHGRDDSLSNLVALLPLHHVLGKGSIHEDIQRWALWGFLLPAVGSQEPAPAEHPIRLYGTTWVHLSTDGTYLRDGEPWSPVGFEFGEAV